MWPEVRRTWQCTQVPFREDRTDHAVSDGVGLAH
jgi:hypothetical protein